MTRDIPPRETLLYDARAGEAWRFYVAAPSVEWERAKALGAALEGLGYVVTSTWWNDVEETISKGLTDKDLPEARWRELAEQDLRQLDAADFVLVLTGKPSAGREFETGFALGRTPRRDVVRIGPATSIFHTLVSDAYADTFDFLEMLVTDTASGLFKRCRERSQHAVG